MKRLFFYALVALAALALAGCSKDEKQQISVDVESIPATEAQMTKKIVVSSNTPWTATGQTDWCKVSPDKGGKGDTPVTVTIFRNDDHGERTAKLAFAGTEVKSGDVVVTQLQKNAIVLEKKNYDFDFKGGILDFTAQSNVKMTVEISKGKEWIARVESRALSDTKLFFDVDKNLTGTDRTGEIVLKNTDSALSQTITVVQTADGAINIPDAAFKAILVAKYDKNADGEIFLSEAKGITLLDVRDKRLKSVEGIEYMPALKTLYLDYNDLAKIDLNNNTALTNVSAQGQGSAMSDDENQNPTLTSLKMDKCTKLTDLDILGNPLLKTLDVGRNVALKNINCADCGLTALDVTKNTALVSMYCSDNDIVVLDLGSSRLLSELYCKNTKLTTLDVSACTSMKTLDVRNSSVLKEIWLQAYQTIRSLRKDSAAELKYK